MIFAAGNLGCLEEFDLFGGSGPSCRAAGNVTVSTITTGADIDPDGYTVSLVGEAPRAIGANGSVTFASVSQGYHRLTLTGMAANCVEVEREGTPDPGCSRDGEVLIRIQCSAIEPVVTG